MLKRIALSAITAVACVAAGAGAAYAQTTAASAHRAGLDGIKVVNLHRSFEGHLAHVKPHKISGIIYARGKQPRAAAKANAACTEPNCDLVYQGGPVQHSPQVFIDFWGPKWTTGTGAMASAKYVKLLFKGLGGQPQDDWSTITSQYGDGAGYPSFTGGVFKLAVNDTSTPPAGVDQTQLAAEADAFGASLAGMGYTINTNTQLIIATQSGTCPQGFYAPNCNGGSGVYCAWHSASNEPYTNLPYLLDAGAGCGENFVNTGSAGLNDGWSIVAGHEYAETITDPIPDTGWIDMNDQYGGEIGDKCAWGGSIWQQNPPDPSGNLKLSTGTFAMQSLWDNSTSSCVMAAASPEDTVSVTNPGNQANKAGDSVSVQMSGASSGGNPLEWNATGLPTGLTINGASGLISGSPTAGGTYNVTVTASDATGASGSAAFTWTVSGGDTVTVTKPANQTTYVSAKADLQLEGTSSGGFALTWSATGLPPGARLNASTGLITGAPNTAGVYSPTVTATDTNHVSGSATFSWTVKADVGKPIKDYGGKCLDDHSSIVTTGNKVDIYSCNGTGAQKWSYSSTNPKLIVLGVCLTDPAGGGPGAKLVVQACHNYKSQTWTHKSNGEYVLKLNGLCLTDPGGSTTNGTQVQLRTCHDYTDQRWSLP